MPVFYTHRNREELATKAQRVPDDIFIPFNAGRQLKDIKRGLTGQFYNERPSNGTSLREWINEHGRISVYEVANITERDALDDNDSDYKINEGDIAYVEDSDGLGNPGTYIYTSDRIWLLIGGGSNISGTPGNLIYYPIPNLRVRATKLGVTALQVAGLLTITVPNTVELVKLDYIGDQTNLDSNNDIQININYEWDNGSNKTFSDVYSPIINLWDRTLPTYNGNVISDSFPIQNVPIDISKVKIIGTGNNDLLIKFYDFSMLNRWGLSITL